MLFTIIICLLCLSALFCFYMVYRNDKVADFRNRMSDLVFRSSSDYRPKLKIYDRVSYEEMLHKFWKPLKLESFFTKEEIDILKG